MISVSSRASSALSSPSTRTASTRSAAIVSSFVRRPAISRPETKIRRARELDDDLLVAASRLGLTLERAQLTADFAQEVLQPEQVGLGGVEAAFGLLLASAVLQHAGRFFDDAAPFFRSGVEHGIDLALADDHVLLAPDTGVGEQLLDVEQTARRAVDHVLAVAGAEQDAGDRDLVEFDREHARRVVEGETRPRPGRGRDASRYRRR